MRMRLPLYAKILCWFFLNLALLAGALYLLVRAEFRFGMDWVLSAGAGERLQAVSDIVTGELNEVRREEWSEVLRRFSAAYRVNFYVFRDDGVQLAGETITLPEEVRERLPPPNRPYARPMSPPWGARMQPAEGLPGVGRVRSGRGEGEALEPAGAAPGVEPLGLPPEDFQREGVPPPGLRGIPGRVEGGGAGPMPPRLGGGAGGAAGWLPRPPVAGDDPPPVHPKTMLRTTGPTRYWMLVRTRINAGLYRPPQPVSLVAMSPSLQGGGLFFDPKPWLAVVLGAAVFSALFWLPFIRSLTRSIGRISDASRQIAEGKFEVRVKDQRRDELGQLGETINHMAARIEGLVTGQKRFLGDVAHELCSPLARLRVALGIIEQRADESQQRYVAAAAEKAEHMATLVNELLSFSKASLGARQVALGAVPVRDVVQKVVQREMTEGAVIGVEVGEELRAVADPELLGRAVANLVRNSLRYAGDGGAITVRAVREKEWVNLSVSDGGAGVAEAELERIFDPFYRVDSSRDRATGGVGLGLAIVKTCVESCRGTVTARNRVPTGLEVTIRLAAA